MKSTQPALLTVLLLSLSFASAFQGLSFTTTQTTLFLTFKEQQATKQRQQGRQPVQQQVQRRSSTSLQSSTAPSSQSFSNETSATSSFFPSMVQAVTNNPGTATSSSLSAERRAQLTLLFRSSLCSVATVATWAMVKHAGLTIVQASALQGLLGCLVFPKPYAMAWFCGSFAGMSAQPAVLEEAALLALSCTGVFFQFENHKLALGRGGRLGLIAFLSNLVYYVVRQGPEQFLNLGVDLLNQIRPNTAVGVALCSIFLAVMRQRATKKYTSLQQSIPLRHRLLQLVGRSTLLTLLLHRLTIQGTSSSSSLMSVIPTMGAILIPSLLAWKSQYTIFPVALLGVVAGFFAPTFAAPVYLGGFIGMTGLAGFGVNKFARASALSAILLKLGILGGFGGRLGFLAYLGVIFGM